MSDYWISLSAIADLSMGETIIGSDCDGTGTPIYSADTGGEPWKYSSKVRRNNKEGTIIVGARGSIGHPRMPNGEFASTQTTITIAADRNEIRPKYLLWALRRLDFSSLSFQQAVPMLTVKDFGRASILVFPKGEQRLIAGVLDTLDTQIHKTEALIAKLEKIKEGLLHDLLTRGIDENGRLRPSPEQAPDLYKESPLGLIPREWEPKTIGHLSSSIMDGPFGSNLKTEHYVADQGIRVVRLQNITPFDYDDSDRAFITDDHASSLLKNTVKPGDLLIASLGDGTHPAGRACLYPIDLPEAINKADCFRLRADSSLATNNYIMLFMNSGLFVKQARKWTQGVTLQRINTTNLRRIFISCPSLEEQYSISQKINKSLFFLATQKEEVSKLKLKKRGLMDDLLTGRVRVTPLLDQATTPA